MRTSTFCRLCSSTRSSFELRRARASTARRGCSGCVQRLAQEAAGDRSRVAHQIVDRARGRRPRRRACRRRGRGRCTWSARRIVSSSCSTTTSVLPLLRELRQRVEQDLVVARMQADGRLVEHVAHALQVGAELRREADALRLAARQRRRGAVEREIAEADRSRNARRDLISASRSRAISALAPFELQLARRTRTVSSIGLPRERRRCCDRGSARAARPGSGAGRRRSRRRAARPRASRSTQISSPRLLLVEACRARGRCRSSSRTSRAWS